MSDLVYKLLIINTIILLFLVIIIYYRFKKISWLVNNIFVNKKLKQQEQYLKAFLIFITLVYYFLANYFIIKTF